MFCGNCGKENTDDALFCEECGAPLAQSTRKNHWGLTFGILGVVAAAIVVVVILLFNGIISLSRGGSGNKTSDVKDIVYMKNGTFYYVKDITKNEPVGLEFGDTRGINVDDEYTSFVYNFGTFGGSGKYFYFFSKYDEDDYEGTLCRIPISKISKDADKNERNVEEIATGVRLFNFRVLSNDSVVFLDDDELNLFDGKEVYELADDVESYYITEDEKSIYYLGDRRKKDSTMTLFSMPLKKNAESTEIDDGIYSWEDPESDFITYAKDYDEDEYTADLYLYTGDKTSEFIEESVSEAYTDVKNKAVYYLIDNSYTAKAYDYVNDPYAKEDANAKEPVETDYLVPSSQEVALSDSAKRSLNYYYDGDIDRYLYANAYMTDDGYYHIYNNGETYYYYPGSRSWGRFDQDAYQEGWRKYDEIENRIYLREGLKDLEIEIESYELYRYANGKSELIADGVVDDCENVSGVWFFPTMDEDEPEALIDIDQISYSGEVQSLVRSSHANATWNYVVGNGEAKTIDFGGELNQYYGPEDGKTIVLEIRPESAKNRRDEDVASTTDSDDEDDEDEYEDYEGYRLVRYQVKNSSIEEDSVISEEAWLATVDDDVVYFYKNADNDGADLYQWKNGKESRIVKGVVPYAASCIGEDGYFAIGTDRDDDGYEYTLYDSKGEKVGKVDDEIQTSSYFKHDRILYIKNDSLYVYNGKGSTRIDKKVNNYWYNGVRGATYITSPYTIY